MANLDINDPLGLPDVRRGRGTTGNHNMAEVNNMTSINAMRTRLQALDAGYFTNSRLETMTENDMAYALRVRSADATGIK